MRARLPWILFAISLVLNLCAVGGYLYVTRLAHASVGRSPVMAAAESMKLTGEQKEKLEALRKSVRQTTQDMRSTVAPLRRELFSEFDKPQPDFAVVDRLIDQISATQAQSQKATARAVNDFQNSLSAEQREEFRQRLREVVVGRAWQRALGTGRRDERPRQRGGQTQGAPATQQ